jgi:signal peptidase I
MRLLLIYSFLSVVAIFFPAGILLSILAKKLSRSERSLWAYCRMLVLIALAVFLAFYLTSFILLKTYQTILMVFLVFGLMLVWILFFLQKSWQFYEKLAVIIWGIIVLFIVVFLSYNYSLYQPFVINDTGMTPVYGEGDLVFCQINRGSARRYSKGDVVTFRDPDDKGKIIVRKIVATSGDRVEINGEQLLINGQIVRKVQANELIAPITLMKGQYFVLTEKEENIFDSKIFGPITSEDIYTKVMFKINWL